jgi:hypothetical protein
VFIGKIRVYVRVRPFSKSEAAKNCEESVVKDGKMTVLVKGLGGIPDAKKYYDFDQVMLYNLARGRAAVWCVPSFALQCNFLDKHSASALDSP